MAHVLALDAWVGNADRHQGNWSLVESRGGDRSFSPMYDPATCLGVELQDSSPLMTASGRTARNGPSRSHKTPHRDHPFRGIAIAQNAHRDHPLLGVVIT